MRFYDVYSSSGLECVCFVRVCCPAMMEVLMNDEVRHLISHILSTMISFRQVGCHILSAYLRMTSCHASPSTFQSLDHWHRDIALSGNRWLCSLRPSSCALVSTDVSGHCRHHKTPAG